MSNDDRTFRVSFSGDGVVRLRETVKQKLKEFMGDYTDDTLAEYVIVLLRNGRHKEEAGKELNVFLGDDSIAFVSWLWDHLSTNLHLYLQSTELSSGDSAKRYALVEQSRKHTSQSDQAEERVQLDSEYDSEKAKRISKSRHNREWKDLVQNEAEPLLLRSTVVNNFHSTEKITRRHSPVRRSLSPKPIINKKRNREDDELLTARREVASRPMLATRRLLQFAVRDAVRTVQHSISRPEPSTKRLRSVISSSTMDASAPDISRRIRSIARLGGIMTTAIKAAAEAAEDVKVKSSVNVFDRLGHGSDRLVIDNLPSNIGNDILDQDDEDIIQMPKHLVHERGEYHGDLTGDTVIADRSNGMLSDSGSDYEGYDKDGNVRSMVGETSQSASFAPKDDDSLMVQYSVSQNANDKMRKTSIKDQDPSSAAATNTSSKIVNLSVNMNTWKPSNYQVSRDIAEVENQMDLESKKEDPGKFQAQLPKNNDTALVGGKNEAKGSHDGQKIIQRPVPAHGSYSSSRPCEDADSRTVFVSNVHFGATKDTLSRHFNKFGEVLKVVIVTDATTGQPKGSAYVEFLRKESAELALSLNGTSFMSRILKVVRRGSAMNEATAMMPWPRTARAASFGSRLGRVPYSRGLVASPFRARLPVKPGARSLQWKRDTPGARTTEGAKNILNSHASGNTITTPTGRNLTYVRNQQKSDGNVGLA